MDIFLSAFKCFPNFSVLSNYNFYYKIFKRVIYRFHVVAQSLKKITRLLIFYDRFVSLLP